MSRARPLFEALVAASLLLATAAETATAATRAAPPTGAPQAVPSTRVTRTVQAPEPAREVGGLPVEPGLWEISWQMPDPLGGEPLRQRDRRCVRERSITAEHANRMMEQCRISKAVIQPKAARWSMRCDTPAGPVSGQGSLRSNGSLVAGTVDLAMSVGAFEIPVTSSFRARRIGDCR